VNSLIKIFYNYGQKENKFINYKSLINFIKNIHFSDKEYYKLLSADGFANSNMINDGVDFFKKDYNVNLNIPKLQYKLFIPYISEKLIVFADQDKGKKLFIRNNISKIYNTFNGFGNLSKTTKDKFRKKLMFMVSYEQIYIQENNHTSNMIRLLKLYKDTNNVDNFISNKFGLSFEKLIFLHWVLFGYIFKNKKTTIYFSITDFKNFATNNNDFDISTQEIENFLNYVLITKENFKKKYLDIRKKQNTKETKEYISYEKLTYIDRYLPRISYWYPLIKSNNNQMKLISYTSLLQFMKFDKLYSLIYHNDYIDNFKSKIHGHCVTNYIQNYAKDKITQAKVYGDEVYSVGRNEYQAPDIIIEFDNYVLIIEAKSKPFNIIEALTEFDVYIFNKIKNDVKKSINNINRYLENQNSFEDKKIYKFVCYFFDYPSMLSEIEEDISDLDRIIITDIHSIESLLSVKNQDYNKIIDEFLKVRKEYKTSSLYHFIISKYEYIDNSSKDFDDFVKSFIKE
jgi:hypothetical protein